MPLGVVAALQEHRDKENVKVRENDEDTALRTLLIYVFSDREWERGWWEGPTLRPLTHWTFIPNWQMTRFYEAPWAPSTSPQSSHSVHQHPQQCFSPLHAPLMWDRAKPCNTKRLGIIHMFAPATHLLTGRELFSTRTPINFRCGRFVLMSRGNSKSDSSRPTYAQLGVFSSPEEKIIQREREKIRERVQFSECYVSTFTPRSEMVLCVCAKVFL